MIALNIPDVKNFMSKLLVQGVFDSFLLVEAELLCGIGYTIRGRRNREWYEKEELLELSEVEYTSLGEQRGLLYQLIKGKKPPQSMKLVLLLPKENTKRFLEEIEREKDGETIEGLFLNLRYEKGEISLTTGTSLTVFTMDKTIDNGWDEWVKRFLTNLEIVVE
jgi:hypothetical protein